ncbi:MAG: hypothetical protein Q7J67_10115 [bacterium]|nr:hypothetical protein [bacterium]
MPEPISRFFEGEEAEFFYDDIDSLISEFYLLTEVPFSKYNLLIYSELYVLENWLRRIIYTLLLAKFGKDWKGVIPEKILNDLKRRLKETRDRVYLDCENNDNVIWLTTLGELSQLFKLESIMPILKDITTYSGKLISSKIEDLGEIRNIIGHNRAIGKSTFEIYRGVLKTFNVLLKSFKNKIIHMKGIKLIRERDEYSVPSSIYFNIQNRHNKGKKNSEKLEALFIDTPYFYFLWDIDEDKQKKEHYVNISTLLDLFGDLTEYIMAFFLQSIYDTDTMGVTGLRIAIPKNCDYKMLQKIYKTFLRSCDSIWTDKRAYDEQEAKFVCHPKIWFYETEDTYQEIIKSKQKGKLFTQYDEI